MKDWIENLMNIDIEMKARTFALILLVVLVIGMVLL